MTFLKTAAVFFLFLMGFSLMWIHVYRKMRDWRSSFVCAFLYFGTFVWVLTEALSFFKILGFAGLLCGWIGYNVILLASFVFLYKKGKMQIEPPNIFPLRWEYCALGIILSITFFIAVAYPPNNWDSMTYHLPRIEHWLQNKSLNHYYTSNGRQLISAPFAEILVLQGRALSGDEYLMNLVQWFAFFGSIICVSKITNRLGMNKAMQIASALFFATVPMAILQASSTQTDLVETFCIICLAERFLAWRQEGTFRQSIDFGLALGLSILTKGTAYPIAFPFVLYYAVITIKHFRKRFLFACLAVVVCLALNFPHWIRNYTVFANPLGVHSGTVSNLSIKSFIITFVADIYANLAFPLPWRSSTNVMINLNKLLENMWNALKVGDEIFPFGRPVIQGIPSLANFHEDGVKNFINTILIIMVFIVIFILKKRKYYALLVIGSWCMFAYCIPWQPWITRLQLPLFALSAPVFSLALENKNRVRNFLLLFLACFALLPLLLNRSRPLLPVPIITSQKAIWNTDRDEIVFSNRDDNYSGNYRNACAAITNAQNIGIIIGGDSWEWPLWRYVRKNLDNKKVRITHVKPEAIEQDVDTLFILDQSVTPFISNTDSDNGEETEGPWVLRRNAQNEWEVIFSPSPEK